MWYLIARARVVACRLSVALVVHFLVDGAPTFFCVLGSHQGGAQANAVIVTGLQVVQEERKKRAARLCAKYPKCEAGRRWLLCNDFRQPPKGTELQKGHPKRKLCMWVICYQFDYFRILTAIYTLSLIHRKIIPLRYCSQQTQGTDSPS